MNRGSDSMRSIPVQDAVGKVLRHDITEIVPGEFKGPRFKKGHVITVGDIDKLLDLGKRYIYVFDLSDGCVHENYAAERIARAAAGEGITLTAPVEGKVSLKVSRPGLLKVKARDLCRVNMVADVMFSTLHTHQTVSPGQTVGGTRIIPLVIDDRRIETVETICRQAFPIVSVKPFRPLRVGMVITGSEVYSGRIEDKFGPVVKKKFEKLGSRIEQQVQVSDDVSMTVDAILRMIDQGLQFIAVTGGMSVDPDDQTPAAIRAAGGAVVTYGAPVLPGAMFMLAYIGDIPIVGLPGCVMYYHASVFDLVVPPLLAGEIMTREMIAALGHGGLCTNCTTCRYPACPFGKGGTTCLDVSP